MSQARRIINVYVADRVYQVDLDSETVHALVFRRCAWRWVRTTSKAIETAAILRASDSWHRCESTAHQHDVPEASRELMRAEFAANAQQAA